MNIVSGKSCRGMIGYLLMCCVPTIMQCIIITGMIWWWFASSLSIFSHNHKDLKNDLKLLYLIYRN